VEYFDAKEKILGELFETRSSDEIQNIVAGAGLRVDWELDDRNGYSNKTRKRAYQKRIRAALKEVGEPRRRSVLQAVRDKLSGVREQRPEARTPLSANALAIIAGSRLDELRGLSSARFDFKKLVRLCEELNTVYRDECYFATAMLTRALLDHVPPLFGKNMFSEVANNYGGGGRSFKENMHALENAARKMADGHLHMPIRKSETLPVAQQVNFAPQLDVLLSEIIRISR
jgi:hypothetical protein